MQAFSKFKGTFTEKNIIMINNIGFSQAEFQMPSTSIKTRDLFKYIVTNPSFKRDLVNSCCEKTTWGYQKI